MWGRFIITVNDLDTLGQFSGTNENDRILVENPLDPTSYTILGLAGNDDIETQKGNDIILGMEGDDTIEPGLGDDLIFGNEGNDRLKDRTNSNDDIADTMYGGQGNDVIISLGGNDVLFGNVGDDTIDGVGFLFGGQGNDVLEGNFNSDTLSGDKGRDTLEGGSLNDTFILAKTSDINEIPTGTENADLITDFDSGQDTIAIIGTPLEQILVRDITTEEIDEIFGLGAADRAFDIDIIRFLAIEAGGELLGIVGGDDNDFSLSLTDDFIVI